MVDLLVRGTLHTLDPSRPRAEAALICDGRFARVGSATECERAARGEVRALDLGAGCAVPGLADAHGHPYLHGRQLVEVRLQGGRSEAECVERVRAFARNLPRGSWVRGGGWDQNLWPGAAFPDAAALSQALPDRPVALSRTDVHALWCNDAALRLAGIGAATPDPPGGRLLRGPGGAPTGVLIDTAMDLVLRAIPRDADSAEALLSRSLRELTAAGICALHDAAASPDMLAAYRRMAERDALPVRVYAMIDGQGLWDEVEEQLLLWRETPRIGRLTVRSVKLFADGALGSRGAAMLDPYNDDPGNTGLWLMDPVELRRRILRVSELGYQPCVHCIGDRACKGVLEVFRDVPRSLRPRAEHLQILRPEDVPLLRASGAVASMQPTHATSDGAWAEERLGHGTPRQKGAYAWRTVLEAGAPLAFGSDFPVEDIDPRRGLLAAVERRTASGAAWMPEQRLTLEEALRAFTWGAAYAELAERSRGIIREGADADLTLFGADLFSTPDLAGAPILGAVVGGRIEGRSA